MPRRTEPTCCARRSWHHRVGGFSLIEMLVALAVFALAVLGLLNLAGESTRTAVVIQERVLAGVVADNQAVEAMAAGADGLAATGGSEVAGDQVWRWTRAIRATDNPDILRVDITVRPEREERISAEISLFLGAPQ